MGLVKETVEEATELILSKFSDDCFHYYWIVKLVIKLVVFLKKKQKTKPEQTQRIFFSQIERKIENMLYGHQPLETFFFSPVQ